MNNKEIKLLICSIFITLLLVSCENGLDISDPDKISTSQFWKTEKDVKNAVNATYGFTFQQSHEQGLDLLFFETISDHAYAQHSNQFNNFTQISLGAYESNHGAIKYIWDKFYTCIRRCNDFMDNIDRVTEISESKKNAYIGEVLFQRAYSYYYLTALWGDVPLALKVISPKEANSMKRTSKDEVIGQIIKDLDFAIANLPVSYDQTNDSRATKWAALALKSRVCLEAAGDYSENPNSLYWQLAVDAANRVINESNHSLYKTHLNTLGAADNYRLLFVDNNASASSSEVIYETQFSKENRPLWGVTLKLACVSDHGWNSFVPTKDLVDAYYMQSTGLSISESGSGYDPNSPYDGRDPRMDGTILYPGNYTLLGLAYNPTPASGSPDAMELWNGTKTGYGLKKFIEKEGLNIWATGKDFPLLRLAEVLLNYAEAKNEVLTSPDASIYAAINKIRERAEMPPLEAGLTKDKMRKRIRDERRVELAFEGRRYFDIKRWKIGQETLAKDAGWILGIKLADPANLIVNDKGYVRAGIRTFTNKNYLWPIPNYEIQLNPNLLPNNPGWD